jgi:hypothetical protein
MNKERKEYEAPALIDFGTVDEVTQGTLKVNTADFPIGAKIVDPVAPPPASAPVR